MSVTAEYMRVTTVQVYRVNVCNLLYRLTERSSGYLINPIIPLIVSRVTAAYTVSYTLQSKPLH